MFLQCPGWTDWHIRLPRSGDAEISVTTGDLLISTLGQTEKVAAGNHITLSAAKDIFLYNTGKQGAEVILSGFPAGKVRVQKIPVN